LNVEWRILNDSTVNIPSFKIKIVDNFKPQKTIFLREIPKFAMLEKKD